MFASEGEGLGVCPGENRPHPVHSRARGCSCPGAYPEHSAATAASVAVSPEGTGHHSPSRLDSSCVVDGLMKASEPSPGPQSQAPTKLPWSPGFPGQCHWHMRGNPILGHRCRQLPCPQGVNCVGTGQEYGPEQQHCRSNHSVCPKCRDGLFPWPPSVSHHRRPNCGSPSMHCVPPKATCFLLVEGVCLQCPCPRTNGTSPQGPGRSRSTWAWRERQAWP